MRKQFTIKKKIIISIPVWHNKPNSSFDKFPYNRQMVYVPFYPGTYNREEFDNLIMRGCSTDEDTMQYLASCGYVPGMEDGEIVDVTTGLDPLEELH